MTPAELNSALRAAVKSQPWAKDVDLAREFLFENPGCSISENAICKRLRRLRGELGIDRDAALVAELRKTLVENPELPDAVIATMVTGRPRTCRRELAALRTELGLANTTERLQGRELAVIDLIAELSDPATVRQIYYLATARDLVPKNEAGYGSIQRLLVRLRREGLVPWASIEDRGRFVRYEAASADIPIVTGAQVAESILAAIQKYTWDVPTAEMLVNNNGWEAAEAEYGRARTRGPCWELIDGPRPIVLCEKDALAPTVQRALDGCNVPVISTRGFASASQLRDVALAIDEDRHARGHVLLWLHDFDESGARMERSTARNMRDDFGVDLAVEHVALTAEQVEQWGIQTRGDKQAARQAAELDAIPPDDFRRIVRESVTKYIPDGHDSVKRIARLSRSEFIGTVCAEMVEIVKPALRQGDAGKRDLDEAFESWVEESELAHATEDE